MEILDVVVVVLGFLTVLILTVILLAASRLVLSVAVRCVELLMTQLELMPEREQLLFSTLISVGN